MQCCWSRGSSVDQQESTSQHLSMFFFFLRGKGEKKKEKEIKGRERRSLDHRAGMAKLEIIKLLISLPPVAYLAIFSSSRSLGSNSKLRSYISCTSPAAWRLLRR